LSLTLTTTKPKGSGRNVCRAIMASSEKRLLQLYVHFLSMVASCRRLLELELERS